MERTINRTIARPEIAGLAALAACAAMLGAPGFTGTAWAQQSEFVGVPMLSEYVPNGEGEGDALGDWHSEFDLAGEQICYYLDVEGLRDPTGLEIHEGEHGENGALVLQLPLPVTDDDQTCVTVERALMDRLLADRADFYIVVTATGKPDGAIRGQLGF